MKRKIFLIALLLAAALLGTQSPYSQMKFGAGMFRCNIDGDTVSFDLKTDQNDLYYMTMGGTADFGLIKIQWNDITASQVKVETLNLEKGFVETQDKRINVIWGDFYTSLPNIIKTGKLAVTSNTGTTITGTLELTVELGGNPLVGEFLKGKKESVLRYGYFEINY